MEKAQEPRDQTSGAGAKQELALRVLMIEDQANDAELALYELKKHGLRVESQRVWREPDLIDALESFEPDVVLSDYSMPGMDGLQSFSIAHGRLPEVPFIFVSGTIGEERATQALRDGAVDYVLKSNMARLGPAVERAVREARERDSHRRLEAARQRLAAIVETTPDLVGICDTRLSLHYLNAAGLRLLGLLTPIGEGGVRADFYLPEALCAQLLQDAIPFATHYGTWEGEGELCRCDGAHVPVSLLLIVHPGGVGQPIEFVSLIARDLRERRGYESRIRYLANFDALTDLPNRTLLHDRLTQAIHHCRRSGGTLALMMLDIDRFSLVNESYGQAAGDRLLRELAARIVDALPAGATVARLASDTFAVLATDMERPDDALVLATGLSGAIAHPLLIGERELQVSTTIGITLFPRDGDTPEVLLRNADSALSRGKEHFRGGVQFYNTAMTEVAIERLEIEAGVRAAIRNSELVLFYQPQFEISTRRLVGVEALIRWNHPNRGLLSPAQVIPVAEQIGAIVPIGAWALDVACAQAMAWTENGRGPVRVGVNVSPVQLRSADFGDVVARALGKTGLPPACLELEITESTLMSDVAESTRVLKQLKRLGVLIAVDDFGTGYSSLGYLSRFPIDRLKIDQSFVARITEDQQDMEIVHAILSLAHALNLHVIAEGVETETQLRMLEEAGCEEMQGYLLGRPMPADALAEKLKD